MSKTKKPKGSNFNATTVPLLETTENGWTLPRCIAFSLARGGFVTHQTQWSRTNQSSSSSSSTAYQGLLSPLRYAHTSQQPQ